MTAQLLATWPSPLLFLRLSLLPLQVLHLPASSPPATSPPLSASINYLPPALLGAVTLESLSLRADAKFSGCR
jgi:hypothetical protein